MKVEVTEEFKDKYTKKLYTPGDVIEVTQKRLDEILGVGDLVKPLGDVDKTEKGK